MGGDKTIATPGFDHRPVLLFDGVCNLCNNSVNFILDRDKKERFFFASLQSDYANYMLSKFGDDANNLDSVVLIHQGRLYKKSRAVLRAAKLIGRGWQLLYFIFIIIPTFIANPVYDIIARNRYKWFGKRESCRMPTLDIKARFLD